MAGVVYSETAEASIRMLSLWRDAVTGVGVVRLTEAEEVHDLVLLFEGVAQEEGWQPGEALHRWVPRSLYFALEAPGDEAPFIGGLQLVLPDSRGTLPCQELWPETVTSPPLLPKNRGTPSRYAHVAMLAVESEFRGQSNLFWSLAVEMWRTCVGESITTLFLEVTPRVLPIYRRLGWPLHIRGELRQHWGEDCYLCTLGIPEVAQALLERAETSPYYRQIIAQAFRVTFSTETRNEDVRRTREPRTSEVVLL